MPRPSGNKKLQQDIPAHYQRLIDLSWIAVDLMFAADFERKNPHSTTQMYGYTDDSKEASFRSYLKRLYVMYGPKFNQRKDVTLPENLQEKLGDQLGKTDIDDLTFEECMELTFKIRELQEQLGHTSMEREQYEEQGFGVSKDGGSG